MRVVPAASAMGMRHRRKIGRLTGWRPFFRLKAVCRRWLWKLFRRRRRNRISANRRPEPYPATSAAPSAVRTAGAIDKPAGGSAELEPSATAPFPSTDDPTLRCWCLGQRGISAVSSTTQRMWCWCSFPPPRTGKYSSGYAAASSSSAARPIFGLQPWLDMRAMRASCTHFHLRGREGDRRRGLCRARGCRRFDVVQRRSPAHGVLAPRHRKHRGCSVAAVQVSHFGNNVRRFCSPRGDLWVTETDWGPFGELPVSLAQLSSGSPLDLPVVRTDDSTAH